MPRLNYTNRIKIDNEKIQLMAALSPEGIVRVTGEIMVDSPGDYPSSAAVYLHLCRAPHARVSLSVGAVESKLLVSADVPALNSVDGLRLDVQIVDVADPSRRILGICRNVSLASSDSGLTNTTGLLGVRKGDFKWPLWLLNLDDLDGSGAWLEFSTSVVDFRLFPRTLEFQTIVLPEVVRQIAKKIIEELKYDQDPSEGNEPQDHWVRWFESLPGVGSFSITMSDHDRELFVEDVVRAYCDKALVGRRAIEQFGEEIVSP